MKVLKSIDERFHPDIIFPLMDLSVVANAIGRQTIFLPNESPTVVIEEFQSDDLKMLRQINLEGDRRLLTYVITVKKMSEQIPKSVIKGAYVTGPYTLAGLILGAENAAIKSIIKPDDLSAICEFAIGVILNYVELLASSGVQLICVLEPSAVMLGPNESETISTTYVKRICELCDKNNIATVAHVCGNSSHLVEKMCDAEVDALSFDS